MLSKSRPQRPLLSIQETKMLTAERQLNQPVKGPHRTFETPSHSAHSRGRSLHYHAKILGGRQSAARITDQLNPDRSVTEANHQGRSYPGLANG